MAVGVAHMGLHSFWRLTYVTESKLMTGLLSILQIEF